jgi:hypothetical protein
MDASRAKGMTPNKAGRMTPRQPMSTKRTAAFAPRSFILPSPQALRIDVEHVDAFEQEDRDLETERTAPASPTAFGTQTSRRVGRHIRSLGPRIVRRCTPMLNIIHYVLSTALVCELRATFPLPPPPILAERSE